MRRLVAAISLTAALIQHRPAAAQDAPVPEERPWVGVLPDPTIDSLIDDSAYQKDRESRKWLAVRVLDAQTGRPVPGARLTRTPEWIAPERRRPDSVMSAGTANADGIAVVPADPTLWKGDCHWLVTAPGYAAAHRYGVLPESEVSLDRGVRFVGRVLDALGRPVAGARVENFAGCSHGTAAARATTDASGTFVFEAIGLNGQFWFEGPGIRSGLDAVAHIESMGDAPVDVVMQASAQYEGRVVDLVGAPVPDVVVRVFNEIESRGPVTLTDTTGRFLLDGAQPGEIVQFFPPADLWPPSGHRHVQARPGVPFTVTLSPKGVEGAAAPAGVVEVAAVTLDGQPVGGVSFVLVREENGRCVTGSTAETEPSSDEEPPIGLGREAVAAGRYRVEPDEGFEPWTFAPTVATVSPSQVGAVRVNVVRQPQLKIEGNVPSDARCELAIALASRQSSEFVDPESDTQLSLPAACPATLVVEMKDGPVFFFPVGTADSGVRRVTVSIPEPRRVVLPAGATYPELRDGVRDVLARKTPVGLETWAAGRFTLRFTTAQGRDAEVDVDFSAVPAGGTVHIDATRARDVVQKTSVRLVRVAADGVETEIEREELEPGRVVVFRSKGQRTMRGIAPATGELVLRRGNANVHLTIRDAAGQPVDALALVDGEIYAAPTGDLAIDGFATGRVRLVVARRDHVGRGVEFELVLTSGSTVERSVVLSDEGVR